VNHLFLQILIIILILL